MAKLQLGKQNVHMATHTDAMIYMCIVVEHIMVICRSYFHENGDFDIFLPYHSVLLVKLDGIQIKLSVVHSTKIHYIKTLYALHDYVAIMYIF